MCIALLAFSSTDLYVGKYVHFVPGNITKLAMALEACTCMCIWTAYNVSCDDTHVQVFYLFILLSLLLFYAYTCTLYVAL